MYLSRIYLNPKSKDARRDLTDPYQLHCTLCRAFSGPSEKCTSGQFLWRVESDSVQTGFPLILVQSKDIPNWTNTCFKQWLAGVDPAIDLKVKLKLDLLKVGQYFRFRVRTNPSVTRNGKRLGLFLANDQEKWLERKGTQHGFSLPRIISSEPRDSENGRIHVYISQEQMLWGKQHSGNNIRIFSALFDGTLIVTEPDRFRHTLETGLGRGKAMGLGLLSVAPLV